VERFTGEAGATGYAQEVQLKQTGYKVLCSGLTLQSPGLAVLFALLVGFCGVACAQQTVAELPNDPGVQLALQKQAAMVGVGSIHGTVTDADGASVRGAVVTLTDSVAVERKVTTSEDGVFHFEGVPPGKFTVTVVADGLADGAQAGVLDAGESYEIRPIALPVAGVATEVDAMSVQEQAEEEIKVEEKQRLVGFVPNFYVAYNWNSAPLSPGQKFRLAWKNSIDPANTAINAAVAGYQYYENDFNGYGRGPVGYFSRFGANEGDLITGTFVGGAILPVLLHQDPRYFYKGTGTVWSRLEYALESAVMCRSDSGKWEFNYSSVGGDLAAGAIANAYYPASDRDGVALTFEQGLLGAAFDGLGNVVQEFLFKKVTPHSANYPSTTPQP